MRHALRRLWRGKESVFQLGGRAGQPGKGLLRKP